MGGLWSKIPRTHGVFLVGTLAIAGIPPLAGFWSKDEIMAHAFVNGEYGLYLMAAIGALLTAFYMFRLTYLTFYGQSRVDPKVEHHIHESPPMMTVPLIVLAFLAIVGGFLGVPPEHGWIHGFLAGVATPAGADGMLLNKYYVDEFYDRMFVEPCKRLGMIWDWIDSNIIDRMVRAVGRMADLGSAGSTWFEKHVIYGAANVIGFGNHLAAWSWRKLQSGMVHHYAAMIVVGLFLLVHFLLVWLTGKSVL